MSSRSKGIQRRPSVFPATTIERRRAERHPPRSARTIRARHRVDGRVKALAFIGAGVLILAAIFYSSGLKDSAAIGHDAYAYEVAEPAMGDPAPNLVLPGTDGAMFELSAYRGETILLYFHEGLMCQPCWDQIVEIEQNWARYEAFGIDRIVSVTNDPLDLIEQKVRDDGIHSLVLADPDLAVTSIYQANHYGMMAGDKAGHTFLLIDETGSILWRADYGGPPRYTMFVPTEHLIAQMREGAAVEGMQS
jgi:peroxiredoxin